MTVMAMARGQLGIKIRDSDRVGLVMETADGLPRVCAGTIVGVSPDAGVHWLAGPSPRFSRTSSLKVVDRKNAVA